MLMSLRVGKGKEKRRERQNTQTLAPIVRLETGSYRVADCGLIALIGSRHSLCGCQAIIGRHDADQEAAVASCSLRYP